MIYFTYLPGQILWIIVGVVLMALFNSFAKKYRELILYLIAAVMVGWLIGAYVGWFGGARAQAYTSAEDCEKRINAMP